MGEEEEGEQGIGGHGRHCGSDARARAGAHCADATKAAGTVAGSGKAAERQARGARREGIGRRGGVRASSAVRGAYTRTIPAGSDTPPPSVRPA